MSSSRDAWGRLKDLFNEARALPEDRRASYLASACAGDQELRSEVESLLASYETAEDFLEQPAAQLFSHLSISGPLDGLTIGPYQIGSQIGVGGMGDVYKALDTRLGRHVAIKVLRAHLAADPLGRGRFEREARAVAALNHPHICTLYDVGTQDGVNFLVMEFLEGETLAARLANGPVPLQQALEYAAQIASALDKAHRAGIVHRDLKPGNVMLTPGGAKLLDFGLAKPHGSVAQAGTGLARELTGAGTVLGTALYMAPEQVEGKEADARSDLFAFGAVLHEMLTGKKAFDASSNARLAAAILSSHPQRVSEAQPGTPVFLDYVVGRCLAKDPDERWQTARDLFAELERSRASLRPSGAVNLPESADVQSSAARDARTTPLLSWRVGIGLAFGLLLGLTAASSVAWFTLRAPEPTAVRLSMTLSDAAGSLSVTGYTRDLAISPDGQQIVYVAGNGTDLRVRSLDRSEPRVLKGLGMPHHPFFSQDGAWIGFFDGSATLKKVSINGGPAITICRLNSAPVGAAWGPNDTIVFATANTSTGLMQVSAGGGDPTTLTHPETDGDEIFNSLHFPVGGRALLYTLRNGRRAARVVAFDLSSRQQKTIVREGYDARYVATGHLVYGVNGALQVVPFDLERLEVSARPIALTDAVLTTPFGGALDFDISANGTMVYVPAAAQPIGRHMVWVDRQGREESIRAPVRAYTYPRMSPDGRRVAIDTRDQENDVWVWDFSREILTRLTFGPEFDQYPVWVGPGNRLVFGCSRNGVANLFWRAATGDGGDEQLVRSKNPQFPHTISPDGSRVVYREDAPGTGQDLMVVSLGGDRRPQPLLQTSFNELNAEISPDGRWIAYETNETSDYEVFVRPFPNVGDGKWQVSAGGGHKPLWARDGRELFYLSPAGALMSVRTEQAATFAVAGPTRILEGGRYFTGSGITTGRTYDVSLDGQRFLMLQTPAGAPTSLTVVQHWFSELKRLTPSNAR